MRLDDGYEQEDIFGKARFCFFYPNSNRTAISVILEMVEKCPFEEVSLSWDDGGEFYDKQWGGKITREGILENAEYFRKAPAEYYHFEGKLDGKRIQFSVGDGRRFGTGVYEEEEATDGTIEFLTNYDA